jgi:peptide-methionine (S)-S-oxide reductase
VNQRLRALIGDVVQLASLAATLPVAAAAQVAGPGSASRTASEATAVFAAGCYWGAESVFEHVRGVRDVVSGFAVPAALAGSAAQANGHAGYAEAVRVVYDPSRVSYAQLLDVFFLVAHDPTEVDRQGPDIGPQYRSVVFVDGEDQRRAARAYLDELTTRKVFPRPITTEIATARSFRPAEDQDYVAHHPDSPYVVAYDRPKLTELRRRFPALYRP